ncbi:MAG TPA: ChbG/HpnK family deacetylase [Candidatus Angelobacter sp.]
MRRLIINADDFGLTSGINRAITEAGRGGAITSATIMANASKFQEAVDSARSLPGLKTGCHVVLVDGQAVAGNLASLTDSAGRFRGSLTDFAGAALRKQLSEDEVQREVEAQIRKIRAQGVVLTHVDSHKHTHMFPQVLGPILRAARACGIRAVRNPFEPLRSWPAGRMARTPGLWLRSAGVLTFRLFARAFREAIQKEEMLSTDGTVGIAATGKLHEKALLAILQALPEGTWELVCHPGYADSDLRAAGTRLVESRQVELEALTSQETKQTLEARGIELISYADLKQ